MHGDLLLRDRINKRRAMTLIELLVVISIMMLLAAYALPKLEPMSKQRKIREAARAVNVFLSRARSRAIETGRPCGVVFQRVSDDTTDPLSNACTMLYQAEVPPPYAGNASGATIRVHDLCEVLVLPPGDYHPPGTIILKALVADAYLSSGLIRHGDLIQLNGQGPWYEIIDDLQDDGSPQTYDGNVGYFDLPVSNGYIDFSSVTDHWLTLKSVGPLGRVTPWPYDNWTLPITAVPVPGAPGWSNPVPFKILRQPTRTIAQPLSLPVGTCIDLSASGIDRSQDDSQPPDNIADQTFATGADDVVIMFSPNGSVSRYYWDTPADGPQEADAIEPIFLMIGWRENIGKDAKDSFDPDDPPEFDDDELPNWQILSNLWISLNPQTGLISVAENAYPGEAYKAVHVAGSWEDSSWETAALRESRKFAGQAQSKGGR